MIRNKANPPKEVAAIKIRDAAKDAAYGVATGCRPIRIGEATLCIIGDCPSLVTAFKLARDGSANGVRAGSVCVQSGSGVSSEQFSLQTTSATHHSSIPTPRVLLAFTYTRNKLIY
jgi:hypothetical protein